MNRSALIEYPQPLGTIETQISGQENRTAISPHERLRELTAILANGIHRLRAIPPTTPECGAIPKDFSERSANTPVFSECGQIPGESSQTGLDPGARSRPDGVVLTTRERGD